MDTSDLVRKNVTAEQAAEIIDLVRQIPGLRWGFQTRVDFPDGNFKQLDAAVTRELAAILGTTPEDIAYTGISTYEGSRWFTHGEEAISKGPRGNTLEVTLAHATQTGAQIVARGFFFGVATPTSEKHYRPEMVKLSGYDYSKIGPQSGYKLIVHHTAAPEQMQLIQLLASRGYDKPTSE